MSAWIRKARDYDQLLGFGRPGPFDDVLCDERQYACPRRGHDQLQRAKSVTQQNQHQECEHQEQYDQCARAQGSQINGRTCEPCGARFCHSEQDAAVDSVDLPFEQLSGDLNERRECEHRSTPPKKQLPDAGREHAFVDAFTPGDTRDRLAGLGFHLRYPDTSGASSLWFLLQWNTRY